MFMKLIGLTGSIAAGKSTALAVLRELGAHIIDVDEIARSVVEAGSEGAAAIRAAFGDAYFTADGHLERAKLAALVFENEAERKKLEAITHPLINRELSRRVEAIVHEDADAVIIVEVPLLFESGMDKQMDEAWVVVADDNVRLSRLMARNGYTEAEARARMESQMPQQEKIRRASAVIDNSGAPEATRAQIEALFAQRRN